jgi:putative peptidoglycan lipid II flippase
VVLILPATAAAGVYQISQLFYAFFSAGLGEGALTMLSYADRLNQLPLSIIGTALGVAILPAISQAIARGADDEASDVQARAFDLSMLLTLPATLALAVAAVPIIGALFQGGEYSVEAATTTGNILAILVTGLPAYVLVKVLTPGFFAREDTRTPVKIAIVCLISNVVVALALIWSLAHVGIALATAISAWLNAGLLARGLRRDGLLRPDPQLQRRLPRILAASLALALALWLLAPALAGIAPPLALALLVAGGGLVFLLLGQLIGALDLRELRRVFRRRRT